MFMKKTDGKSPSCRLKLDSPSNKLQGKLKSIILTIYKPVDSMQENTNCMKPLRQDDGNRICEKLKSVQDLVSGSGMPITMSGEVAECFGYRMIEKLKFLFK